MSLPLNWDHLRIFLAVMRAKSLRQAAQNLKMSHPTIRRRLEALEAQLNLRLFDRRADGLHATSEASTLLEMAEQVEASVMAFGRCASDINPTLEGEVHVTAPDTLMSELLAPEIAAFTRRWPQIKLRIETTDELADLSHREADVAIRIVAHGSSPQGQLTGRKAATFSIAVYGEDHQWIGWADSELDIALRRDTPFFDRPVLGAMQSVYLQRELCLQGLGLTILPCFMALPGMKRRTAPKPAADVWVLVHPDMRRNPRLRLFRDEMVAAFKRLQPKLEGRGLDIKDLV